MPSDAMVGIITYGAMVMLHELGGGGGGDDPDSSYAEAMKAHVFRGNKELTSLKVCRAPVFLQDDFFLSIYHTRCSLESSFLACFRGAK